MHPSSAVPKADPVTMKKLREKPDRKDALVSPVVPSRIPPSNLDIHHTISPMPIFNPAPRLDVRMDTLKHVDTTTNNEEIEDEAMVNVFGDPLNVSQSFMLNTSPHPKTKSTTIHSWQKSILLESFLEAADKGKLDIIMIALETHQEWINEKLRFPYDDTDTALIKASYKGHFHIVEFLLQNYKADIDMNKTNGDGETALYRACDAGHEHIVEFLLTHGSAVDEPNKAGWSPLCEASRSGHVTIVELLIKHGANINLAVSDGKTPVYFAAANGQLLVLKCLLANGAEINNATEEGFTPLCRAAKEGFTSVVDYLLSQGADLHLVTKAGQTPLHLAVEKRSLSVIRSLLLHGDPPSHKLSDTLSHTL